MTDSSQTPPSSSLQTPITTNTDTDKKDDTWVMKSQHVDTLLKGLPIEFKHHPLTDISHLDNYQLADSHQGFLNWIQKRKHCITATNIGSILGEGYDDYDTLLLKKLGLIKVIANDAMKHGTKHEPIALKRFTELYQLQPFIKHNTTLYQHPKYPNFAATPDGFILVPSSVSSKPWLLEIKCPFKRWLKKNKYPRSYFHQMQFQMEICDADMCIYLEYKPASTSSKTNKQYNEIVQIIHIPRDPTWFTTNLPKFNKFYQTWMTYKKNPHLQKTLLQKHDKNKNDSQ